MVDAVAEANKIVFLIQSIPELGAFARVSEPYRHMGATLCDAGLQAGISYRTVVAPRVRRVLEDYPEARTTSAFATAAARYGLDSMLQWSHPEKLRRILDMTTLLGEYRVESEEDLAAWLVAGDHRDRLLALPGIGPKTVDYLAGLVGEPSIAVDRHLRTFASWAGVTCTTYADVSEAFRCTAELLDIECTVLDRMIWAYVSVSGRHSRAP